MLASSTVAAPAKIAVPEVDAARRGRSLDRAGGLALMNRGRRRNILQRLVRKRCFVQFAGYETVDSAYCHHRFVREMARFHRTWTVGGTVSDLATAADGLVGRFAVETRGPNWRVETDFHFFRWDDFVTADRERRDLWRVPRGIAAMAEFILTGTAFRYLWWAWRFALFFLYPLVAIAGIAWLSIVAAQVAARIAGPAFGSSAPVVVAVVVLAALWWTVDRLLDVGFALDLWIFTRSFAHRARPELDARLERFARELACIARDSDADEIVIHGLSLGAPLALAVVDRALILAPQLAARQLHLVTTGSWVAAAALHPSAGWLRDAVGRVANAPAVYWVELQSLTDPLNFYKVDPVQALGMQPVGKPIIKTVRVRSMLAEATYRRFQFDLLRVHRQTVMGNEQRYFYDYYMLCCGPVPLPERINDPHQAVNAFAADGALLRQSCIDSAQRDVSASATPAGASNPGCAVSAP